MPHDPSPQQTPEQEAAVTPESTAEEMQSPDETQSDQPRKKILIGSQRAPVPAAKPRVRYIISEKPQKIAKPKPQKVAEERPIEESVSKTEPVSPLSEPPQPAPVATVVAEPSVSPPEPSRSPIDESPADKSPVDEPPRPAPGTAVVPIAADEPAATDEAGVSIEMDERVPDDPISFPPPRLEDISDDVQEEIDAALGDVSIDDLMAEDASIEVADAEIEVEARLKGTIVKIHRENIFFALPGRGEGIASTRQFEKMPEIGEVMDVVIAAFNAEEGLFEVAVPGASVQVADWSDLSEGVVVAAVVTGHNKGGLECEVNRIRGFMPAGQVSLYHVDDLEQFVGQKLVCVVTEANPRRRNLILSHRAHLEREREEARKKLFEQLAVGQIHEGIVRNVRDFGAFVDIGGVDGLVHVSKLSWDRVNHPSDVVTEGDKIQVQIDRIDEATGKISLSARDAAENPWTDVESKYPIHSVVAGTVSKIMEFGAFVRLEAGVEGLIHVSELSHGRVFKVGNFVSEGQAVEVKVLAVDADAQRISLSMKAVQELADTKDTDKDKSQPEEEPLREPVLPKHEGPLKGGTNRGSGGEQFGLKW